MKKGNVSMIILLICICLGQAGIQLAGAYSEQEDAGEAGVIIEEEFNEEYEDDPDYLKRFGMMDTGLEEDERVATASWVTGNNPYTGLTYTHNSIQDGKDIIYGVDVSKWQGSIDWEAAKADGIEYVFVRCGYTGTGSTFKMNTDSYFSKNVVNAYNAGLKVGVYYFSQSLTVGEATKEAEKTCELLENYRNMITMPVVYDFEKESSADYRANRVTKAQGTKNAQAFCSIIAENGYDSYYYGSSDLLAGYFDLDALSEYGCWIARYGVSTSYARDYDFWQFTSSGKVRGIPTSVDCNFWYVEPSKSGLSKPGGLKAAARTTDSITIAWNAVSGASQYQVSYSKARGGPYTLAGTCTAANYTMKGLSAGTGYYFVVRPYRSGAAGPQSAELSAYTALAEQTTVTTTANVNLRQMATTSSAALTTVPEGTALTLLYKESDSAGNTWYKVNYIKNGSTYTGFLHGNYVTVSTGKEEPEQPEQPEQPAPAKVSGLKATSATEDSITLSWSAAANATQYRLYYSEKPGGSYKVATTQKGTSYTLKGLSAGTGYYFVARGFNGTVSGTLSSELLAATSTGKARTVQTTANVNLRQSASSSAGLLTTIPSGTRLNVIYAVKDSAGAAWYRVTYGSYTGFFSSSYAKEVVVQTPAKVSGLKVTNRTANTITVSWSKAANATQYRLYYSEVKGGPYTVAVTQTGTSYTLKGLAHSTGYYFLARAFNGTTQGALSSELNASTLKSQQITVQATSNVNLRQLASTSSKVLTTVPKGTELAIGYRTKDASGGVWYRVNYQNGGKTYAGFLSGSYAREVADQAPGKVSGLKVSARGTNSLRLTWNKASNATKYRLYYRGSKDSSYSIAATQSGTSYTLKGLAPCMGYYFTVRAYHGSTAGSLSAELGATTAPTANIVLYTKSNVNLRQSSTTSSKALVTVPKNTMLDVRYRVKARDGALWYRVDYSSGGKKYAGFLHGNYVTAGSRARPTQSIPIRSGGGKQYAALTTLSTNSKLALLSTRKDASGVSWYQVYVKKDGSAYTGFCQANYVKRY